MPTIRLQTKINAPIERVFDLGRSIDLHQLTSQETDEKAVAGKTSGLIELGESVTWRAKHLGVYQNLTVQITHYDRPNRMGDVMLEGAFKSMSHVHSYREEDGVTIMDDEFFFESPMGLLGELANDWFLTEYMRGFLVRRNEEIKTFAETNLWKEVLEIQ